jgi:hypothetical protein
MQPAGAGTAPGAGATSPPRVDDMSSNVAYTDSLLGECDKVRAVWDPMVPKWHRRGEE